MAIAETVWWCSNSNINFVCLLISPSKLSFSFNKEFLGFTKEVEKTPLVSLTSVQSVQSRWSRRTGQQGPGTVHQLAVGTVASGTGVGARGQGTRSRGVGPQRVRSGDEPVQAGSGIRTPGYHERGGGVQGGVGDPGVLGGGTAAQYAGNPHLPRYLDRARQHPPYLFYGSPEKDNVISSQEKGVHLGQLLHRGTIPVWHHLSQSVQGLVQIVHTLPLPVVDP